MKPTTAITAVLMIITFSLGCLLGAHQPVETKIVSSLEYKTPEIPKNSDFSAPEPSTTTKIQPSQKPNPVKPEPITSTLERASPSDWIKESDIELSYDKVIINVNKPRWSKFTDTNSMDPVLDTNANAIEIIPKKPADLQVGDIIAYDSAYSSGTLIHRIVKIGNDGEWYVIAKGDNNPANDPGKIRFHQIKRVVVAIIY